MLQIVLNSIVKFQGRYLARHIYVARIGMPAIDIHLDTIDVPSPPSEGQTAPPPQAKLEAPPTPLAGVVKPGRRILFKQPSYLPLALQMHTEGTVVLWGIIGKDGGVHNLEVEGGSPVFQASALEATKTWRYEPYLINGTPEVVPTEILVYFLIH